jgi:hypothetical protein
MGLADGLGFRSLLFVATAVVVTSDSMFSCQAYNHSAAVPFCANSTVALTSVCTDDGQIAYAKTLAK